MAGHERDSRSSSRLGPFRHAPYAAYWSGGLVSNMGTWLQTVAGSIYIYQLTGSSFAVGLFNFAGFIPILLFSVWGGQLSDRFDRRRLVIVTHLISFVAASVLALVTIAGAVTEPFLIAVTFLLNSMWAIGKPSLSSLIPNIVPREDLQDAVGLNPLQFILGQILGPLVAALIIATAGAGPAFAVNALTYLAPIVAMAYLVRLGLGDPGTEAVRIERAAAARVSGATYLRRHLWVPALFAAVALTAAAMEIQRTLAPALVSEELGQPESAAGVFIAAQGVGSALALLLFVPLRRRSWSRAAAGAGFVVQGAGVVTVAAAPGLVIACLGVGLVGFGFSLCFPVLTAILQDETPDAFRGRIMAYHQIAHLGHRPFTALAVGTIATALGTQAGMLVGLLLVPLGIVALRVAWRALARERLAAGGGQSAAFGRDGADDDRDAG
jgi:MFS family permease